MNMFFRNSNRQVSRLIMEQIKDIEGCLADFCNFIKGAVNPSTDQQTLRALAEGVHHMENAADRALRRMIDALGGAFLPTTRQELIDIGTGCDKIANKCQHVAHMIVYQHFRFPQEYAQDILDITGILQEQFALLEKSVDLLYNNFSEFLKDHTILDDIREHETRVDNIEEALYERIYASPIGLAERMQIAGMVELICDASDIIENVADQIQIVLITRKG